MPYAPLSVPEREDIASCLAQEPEMPFAQIARVIGRDRSTVSREVRRNGGRHGYRASAATGRAQRCAKRPKVRKLDLTGELGRRVLDELTEGRSPAEVVP